MCFLAFRMRNDFRLAALRVLLFLSCNEEALSIGVHSRNSSYNNNTIWVLDFSFPLWKLQSFESMDLQKMVCRKRCQNCHAHRCNGLMAGTQVWSRLLRGCDDGHVWMMDCCHDADSWKHRVSHFCMSKVATFVGQLLDWLDTLFCLVS